MGRSAARGGENISAREVEDLLYAHPAIADVAVVAYPDPRLTERACAVVVPRPGASVDLSSVISYLEGLSIAAHAEVRPAPIGGRPARGVAGRRAVRSRRTDQTAP